MLTVSTSSDLHTVNPNPLAMSQIRNPIYMPSGTRQGSFGVISIAGNLLCLARFIKALDLNIQPEVTLPTNLYSGEPSSGYEAKLSARHLK